MKKFIWKKINYFLKQIYKIEYFIIYINTKYFKIRISIIYLFKYFDKN